ncbi:MAG: cytidylate kinase-like family protein [Oscillospiraceae bacterium]|nr:MAG: cytidylate kinase-like family protein [Oscillospiraceae bacterium]
MNIITISREFGSGGRELGKRLADIKGYDYYDSEIIAAVAKKSGMDEAYIENTLSNHGWRNQAITFRGTLASSAYVESSKVQLLLEQKEVITGIAQMGKDCVIVGRNADVILREYEPLNIFVCASAEAKPKRCRERASAGENLSEKELLRRMKRIDGVRRQTRELMTGSQWGQRDAYQLIVNTTQWEIKQLAQAVAYFADCWFGRKR